jgi:hypothetical protein
MAFLDGGFGAMMVVVVGVGVEGGEIEVVLGLLLVLEL